MIRAPGTHVSASAAAIGLAHLGVDFCQGAAPALLPFLTRENGFNLTQVGALILAINLGSALLQPVLGLIVDRLPRPWTTSFGALLAGLGLALVAQTSVYVLTFMAATVCGIGVALFHPDAGRLVHSCPDGPTRAMGVFAVGGNAGFAMGPIL